MLVLVMEKKKRLLTLIKELKIGNEVVIIDKAEQNLKVALIKNSNLFLMPSIKFKKSVEGFGISFIEAASYGVGSVGGKEGGASDAIENNKTGLICDGESINSIYENILNFLKMIIIKFMAKMQFIFLRISDGIK